MNTLAENIGKTAIHSVRSLQDNLSFAYRIFSRIFTPQAYNSAVGMVLVNQIYFTAVQILPLFFTVAVCLGIVFIGVIGEYLMTIGLFSFFGHLLMGFVVTEIAPFVTVLLIALRSGSAINAEIAVMKVNKELHTLAVFRIDVINYLFLPRIICGIVSVVLLSCLFSIIVLASGLIYSGFFFEMTVSDYITILMESGNFFDLLVMLVKCAVLGFFIVMIPIRYGMRATDELTSIPVAVLNGMVNVFIAIVIIEVLSLIVMSLLARLV